ncbi:poly(A)-specific ribonuclease [Cryomyces antarcticus]|uniref:Poly(A)-specific ribonuclease n=1 Tax=Cryomyces antarcticus TaxID=329879 RepID=A0ABR0LNQ2_9PEZI|nr:poly(A)-specific ribonuclease [Cryomyces antarcticus]KAK5015297.1 poly(A)-specific ribonuclease [Cryomyces antarcticus]KAK5201158.1 poly(A)-specific ribonuclease [Cryomyces antarcticus]
MEADWDEVSKSRDTTMSDLQTLESICTYKEEFGQVARIVLPPPGPQALPTPATTLAFDTSQELLWAGNEYGRVTSFHGAELQKYTSYRGHAVNEGPVKQLLFCEKGVISLSGQSIHLSSRRGLTQWNLMCVWLILLPEHGTHGFPKEYSTGDVQTVQVSTRDY